jgi:hypothetical protein
VQAKVKGLKVATDSSAVSPGKRNIAKYKTIIDKFREIEEKDAHLREQKAATSTVKRSKTLEPKSSVPKNPAVSKVTKKKANNDKVKEKIKQKAKNTKPVGKATQNRNASRSERRKSDKVKPKRTGKQPKPSKKIEKPETASSNTSAQHPGNASATSSRASSRSAEKQEKSVQRKKREANPLDSIPKYEKFHRKPRRNPDEEPIAVAIIAHRRAPRPKTAEKKAEEQGILDELADKASPVKQPARQEPKVSSQAKNQPTTSNKKSERHGSSAKEQASIIDELSMMAQQHAAEKEKSEAQAYNFKAPVHAALMMSALTEDADEVQKPVSPPKEKEPTSNKKSSALKVTESSGVKQLAESEVAHPAVSASPQPKAAPADESAHLGSIVNELEVPARSAQKTNFETSLMRSAEKKSEQKTTESKKGTATKDGGLGQNQPSEKKEAKPATPVHIENQPLQTLGSQPTSAVKERPTLPIAPEQPSQSSNSSNESKEAIAHSGAKDRELGDNGIKFKGKDSEAKDNSGSKNAQSSKIVLEPLNKEGGAHNLFSNRTFTDETFDANRRTRIETPDKAFQDPNLDPQKPAFTSNSKQNNDGTDFTFY